VDQSKTIEVLRLELYSFHHTVYDTIEEINVYNPMFLVFCEKLGNPLLGGENGDFQKLYTKYGYY